MKFAVLVLWAVTAFAQTPEIRGLITEQGSNFPIPGAEIKIYEVGVANESTLVATVFTDTKGAYAYKPQRLGSYRLEARRPGYSAGQGQSDVARTSFVLKSSWPGDMVVTLNLMRPGTLTGRVVDEDRQPIAGLSVYAQVATAASLLPVGRDAVTRDDGTFSIAGLPPQTYFIRIAPKRMDQLDVMEDAAEAFEGVDRDIESGLWPSVPVALSGGATTDIGTIPLRTLPYWKARIQVDGECKDGESWLLMLVKLPYTGSANETRVGMTPCRGAFVLTGIPPGSYLLGASTRNKEDTRWAQAPMAVTAANIEASLRFSPAADVTASIVVPSGVAEANLANVRLQVLPDSGLAVAGSTFFTRDGERRFIMRNLPWQRHWIAVQGLPRTHYVKDLRYGGQSFSDFSFAGSQGGNLDIVIDDHPATIKGKVIGLRATTGTPIPPMAMVAREGSHGLERLGEPFFYRVPVRGDGAFELGGLAPGDYRVHVSPLPAREIPKDAMLVHVSAGETKSVEVRAQ